MLKASISRRPKRRPLSLKRAQMAATFRAAAKRLDKIDLDIWQGCCYALNPTGFYHRNVHIRVLIELLQPPTQIGWWYASEGPALDKIGTRNARIIGLLLCALLIEDNAVPLAI